MKKAFKGKIALIGILIMSLISGGFVFAEGNDTQVETLRMSFPDVPQNNWAQKHVSKLALLGITAGYPNGEFRPDAQVTQQDVIKFAVSMMGYNDQNLNWNIEEDHSDESIVSFINEQVANYARPYVSHAFKTGMLDYDAEYSSNGSWGTTPASREWVSKAVVLSVGHGSLATDMSNVSTAFTDNLDISAWALGYVNAAVELGIVSGFDQGDFRPAGYVTRAQIAAFLSRAEQYLEHQSSRVVIGTVLNLSSFQIRVLDESGIERAYSLHQDQQFYSYKVANNAVASSDIKQFEKVYLITHNGVAYYVEKIDELQLESTEGKLSALDRENLKITVNVDGSFRIYDLDRNVQVTNQDGSGSSLISLELESIVEIRRNTLLEDDPSVLQIIVKQTPVNKVASGTIKTIDVLENEVIFEDLNGTVDDYPLADRLSLTYGNRILSGIVELNAGDSVKYEIVNSVVTGIELITPLNPIFETESGTILLYDVKENLLTIRNVNGELIAREFAQDVEVILEGANVATIKDLQLNDQARLTINSHGEVTKVEILNRKINRIMQVEIYGYEADLTTLILNLDGELKTYKLNEDTKIEFGGLIRTVDELDVNTIFTKGKKVDMTFSNDRLMEIKISNYYDGEILEINHVSRQVKLKTETGDTTFQIPNHAYVEIYNRNSTSLADLNIGDSVRLMLDSSQRNVAFIQRKESIIMRVVEKSSTSTQITVSDKEGKETKHYIGPNQSIKHHSKSVGALSDIIIGKPIVFEYYGRSLNSLYIPYSANGKVSHIQNNRIELDAYDREKRSFTWNNRSEIVRPGGTVTTNLNTVQINDRVEIIEDAEGKLLISMFEARERLFDSYNDNTNEVTHRPKGESVADRTFKLGDHVYIHQNNNVLRISELKFIDDTVFYILNGVLYEIEKRN